MIKKKEPEEAPDRAVPTTATAIECHVSRASATRAPSMERPGNHVRILMKGHAGTGADAGSPRSLRVAVLRHEHVRQQLVPDAV